MNPNTPSNNPIAVPTSSLLLQCPPEILSIIFDPINVDKNELLTRGPLNSSLRSYYDEQLYNDIILTGNGSFEGLALAISKNPNLIKLIRSFTCDYGMSRYYESDSVFMEMMKLLGNVKGIHFKSTTPSCIVLANAGIYQKLESVTLSIKLTATSSIAEQLEPLKHLPKLKSIHLELAYPEFQNPPAIGVTTSTPPICQETIPPQIKSLTIITDDFHHPELLAIARQLQNLTVLKIEFLGYGVIDFNPFLQQISPSRLVELSVYFGMYLDRRDGDNPDCPPISLFLESCRKLEKLVIGLPILENFNDLVIRLKTLELIQRAGVTYDTIKLFMQAYHSNPRNSREEDLNLCLSDFDMGSIGSPGREWRTFEIDSYDSEDDFEMEMGYQEWRRTDWNGAYSAAQAAELVKLAGKSKIRMVDGILDGLEADAAFDAEIEDLEARAEKCRRRRRGDYEKNSQSEDSSSEDGY